MEPVRDGEGGTGKRGVRNGTEGETGRWVFPKVDGNRVASSIHPPGRDVRVRVWEREGWRGEEWGFGFAGGV